MTTISAQQEVAGLASDLIRIDTTNTGDDSGPGERMAAEHVAGLLADVGLEPTMLESRRNRTSVSGAKTSASALSPAPSGGAALPAPPEVPVESVLLMVSAIARPSLTRRIDSRDD